MIFAAASHPAQGRFSVTPTGIVVVETLPLSIRTRVLLRSPSPPTPGNEGANSLHVLADDDVQWPQPHALLRIVKLEEGGGGGVAGSLDAGLAPGAVVRRR